jgi:hypothetical protein
MSLTVIQQPNYLEYLYNPFYFVLSGTNTSQTSYHYLVDVYCSNIANTGMNPNEIFVERFRIPQRINTQMLFTPFAVLKSYVNSSVIPSISAITGNVSSCLTYNLKFGEEYLTGGSMSAYTNITSFSGITIGATKQYEEVWNLDSFDGKNHNAKYLTDWSSTNTKSIYEDEYETLSFLDTSSSFVNMLITTFDISGTTIGVYTLTASTPTTCISWDLPVGTENLNVSPQFNSVILSSQTVIDFWVDTYSISLWDNLFSNQLSETFTYSVNRNCTSKYGKTRIAWMNRKGKMDYFTFTLKRINGITVNNNEWQPHLNFNYNIGDRGRKLLSVDGRKKFTVTSDWLTDAEAIYLEKLIASSDVYLIDGSNKIPLIRTTKDWLTPNTNNDRLFNATIDFEFANDLIIQTS